MEMRFVKTVQFTRLVKAGGRLREFNFRKVNKPDNEFFAVNVVDDRGDRIFFNMQKDQSGWKFSSSVIPAWIGQQEDQLSKAIEDELHNPTPPF
jgi:hypothetical protein